MNIISKAIILNASDGITTPMAFIIGALTISGGFHGWALIKGTIGAAVSMAYAFKSSQVRGTWNEWGVAFICSLVPGLVPILFFMAFSKLIGALLTALWVIIIILGISYIKSGKKDFKLALKDTLKNIVPAIIIVGILSI